jgi:hypothetical protein
MTRNLTVTGWSYSLAVRIPYLVAPLLAAGAIALTASGTIAQAPAPVRAPASGPPRLVVILVADQFRADYVTQYSDMWTAGLKEIFAKGAAFTEAAYPYANTRTCPGHATIGTGMLPSVHGMIDNTWYNVATHEFLACTEDHQARSLPFGGFHGEESHSAKWYLVPNFADELKRQVSGRPRVVSLSLKARSAIGLGGHGGADSTIVWKEDGAVTFATSSALAKAASPALDAFVRSHPVSLKQFETWDRAKPEASYKYTDQAPGEPANRGTFPHLFNDPVRLSDTTASILDSWDGTPAADEYLGAMAEHLITEEKLGQRQTTDFLAVSFSTLDIVGHDYGPRSHEVQDVLLRLDATIGRLLAVLDAKVGRDRYVLAFSSDHGVATLPEQVFPAPAGGRGAGGGGVTGRVTAANVANAVEAALDKHFGAPTRRRCRPSKPPSSVCAGSRSRTGRPISPPPPTRAIRRSSACEEAITPGALATWRSSTSAIGPAPRGRITVRRRTTTGGCRWRFSGQASRRASMPSLPARWTSFLR